METSSTEGALGILYLQVFVHECTIIKICNISPSVKTKTPKELLILYHKDTTEQAKTVYNFFFERNYSCIFHHMDVQKGPYAGTVQQMQHADFVLICISPMLKEAFDSLPGM